MEVGEAAEFLGVSVRTLHYWEERGLVIPNARTWSNYRLYSEQDIARAQRVVVYRATGMPLKDIAAVLEAGDSPVEHLRRQRAMLMERQRRLDEQVRALDTLWEETMNNNNLSVSQIAAVLGDSFADHHAEAEETYGDTEDWAISQRNAARRNVADWEELKQRHEKIERELAAACTAGMDPAAPEALQLVERHRELLGEHFPVSKSKHVLIARGYTADERFRAHYDSQAPGLAQWLQDAINAAAHAAGIDPDTAQWR